MSNVLIKEKKGTAFIFLNREEKMNAFNKEMSVELQGALDWCRDNAQIRAVCITGKGRAFSSGQDLVEISDPQGPGLTKIITEHYNPLIMRIRNLEKPVVAAVNGVAAGAAANLALSCDIVVAAASASFLQAFSKIGLIPDSGGTYFLPRLVGWQKASALMMMADKVSAAEAERIGMIYRVFDDAVFETEVEQLCERLSAMPTRALALTKEALNKSANNSLDQQLDCEDRLQRIAGQTQDFAEGVTSFLQKRLPSFRGS